VCASGHVAVRCHDRWRAMPLLLSAGGQGTSAIIVTGIATIGNNIDCGCRLVGGVHAGHRHDVHPSCACDWKCSIDSSALFPLGLTTLRFRHPCRCGLTKQIQKRLPSRRRSEIIERSAIARNRIIPANDIGLQTLSRADTIVSQGSQSIE